MNNKKKYVIVVKETLTKAVEVYADDAKNAEEKVYELWSRGDIVLSGDDLSYSEMLSDPTSDRPDPGYSAEETESLWEKAHS